MSESEPKKRGRKPLGERAMTEAEKKRRQREKNNTKQLVFSIGGSFAERLDRITEFYGLSSRTEAVRALISAPLQIMLDILENGQQSIEQIEDADERERQKRLAWNDIESLQELFSTIKQSRNNHVE